MLCLRKGFIFPAVFLITVAYYFFSHLQPATTVNDDTRDIVSDSSKEPDSIPPSEKANGKIHWKKRPETYPVLSYAPLPAGPTRPIPRIQHQFTKESWFHRRERLNRRSAVKKVFQRAWNGYKRHAWLRDELSPISGRHRDAFGGWAATLVDSLDSLLIMGMNEEFGNALAALDSIDFTTTEQNEINVFETLIRYVGGFLGAYDLTNGKYPILLQKATSVADMLYDAFDTPNRMPQSRWQWTRSVEGKSILPASNTIFAELGSLNLEFTRLSQLTKDPKYYDASQRIADFLEEEQRNTKLPGLWPVTVNALDKRFPDDRFTVGGMADSTYEYLPKEHILLGARTDQYRKMYETAMDAIKKHLLFRANTKDGSDVLFAGNARSGSSAGRPGVDHQVEHLKCYLGAAVGVGAKVFDRPEELSIGRKLVDGCIWAYDVMPTGIMPEIFYVSACESMNNCEWNERKWYNDARVRLTRGSSSDDPIEDGKHIVKQYQLQPGITGISDTQYLLRPEAIEGVFVLYRITGDKKLQDAAWRMFQNIDRMTKTEYANAAIKDVRDPETSKMDYMESFWLAETLKYFYLIFSEPDLVSLDDYVLNTEAHPFKRQS